MRGTYAPDERLRDGPREVERLAGRVHDGGAARLFDRVLPHFERDAAQHALQFDPMLLLLLLLRATRA